MTIKNIDARAINVIDNLKDLGVKLRGYIVTGDSRGDGKDICVIAAGQEVLTWLPFSDLGTPMGSMFKEVFRECEQKKISYSDRMPYVDPKEAMNDANIYLLGKYKSVPQMNKESVNDLIKESQKFGKLLSAEHSALNNKSEVEKKIVYLYEQYPSTNSLALAKQFDLRHKNVVQTIFELLKDAPHDYNGISWNPYTYKSGKGDSDTYALYLEVNEYVYQKFIRSMGTPKSIEMKIYREHKIEEYYRAFINLRNDHYNRGSTQQEMFENIELRTITTENLFVTISDYVRSYNNRFKRSLHYKEAKMPLQPLQYDLIKRIAMNVVNKFIGVNSFDFSNNRDTLDWDNTRRLSIVEGGFSLHVNGDVKISPKDLMVNLYGTINPNLFRQGVDVVEQALVKDLASYNVVDLWDEVSKYPEL